MRSHYQTLAEEGKGIEPSGITRLGVQIRFATMALPSIRTKDSLLIRGFPFVQFKRNVQPLHTR
jgi:hypothetical protein